MHSWTPQTAAPLDDRVRALKMLATDFPVVGWQVCVSQLERHQVNVSSHRPRWGDHASELVNEVAEDEELAFIRSALDLALAWKQHDEKTLGDLIEHLDGMSDHDQNRVWSLVDAWAETTAGDKAKAELSERIGRYTYSLRKSPGSLTSSVQDAARATQKDCSRVIRSSAMDGCLQSRGWQASTMRPTTKRVTTMSGRSTTSEYMSFAARAWRRSGRATDGRV